MLIERFWRWRHSFGDHRGSVPTRALAIYDYANLAKEWEMNASTWYSRILCSTCVCLTLCAGGRSRADDKEQKQASDSTKEKKPHRIVIDVNTLPPELAARLLKFEEHVDRQGDDELPNSRARRANSPTTKSTPNSRQGRWRWKTR